MALFTDGLISTIADLVGYEAELEELAAAESVDLAQKLKLAQVEVGAQLEAAARRPGHVYFSGAAGWQATGAEVSLGRFELSQVAVTPPLKLWHCYQSLALIFRDIQTRRGGDRYEPKWKLYRDQARWAAEMLLQTGVGLVASPVPRASDPVADTPPGSGPPGSYYFAMTWTGRAGSEGAASPPRALALPADRSLALRSEPAPSAAAGWNVYVWTDGTNLRRQNEKPLALDESWVLPATGLVDGKRLEDGQHPDFYRTVPKFWQRG